MKWIATVISALILAACGKSSTGDPGLRAEGFARFVVGDQWNFSPGYDLERGYVDDHFQISFPITNEGTAPGTPVCKGGIGDEWTPILYLPSVEPGETRWVTGTMVPERPPRRGEDSQGVDCSSGPAS